MSADGIVVAEPIGNSVADLSPRGRSTTEMPRFEAGEFAQLVDGRREDVDPRDAERLKAQMTALVGDDADGRGGVAARAMAILRGR
jgi:hypothetical protein